MPMKTEIEWDECGAIGRMKVDVANWEGKVKPNFWMNMDESVLSKFLDATK